MNFKQHTEGLSPSMDPFDRPMETLELIVLQLETVEIVKKDDLENAALCLLNSELRGVPCWPLVKRQFEQCCKIVFSKKTSESFKEVAFRAAVLSARFDEKEEYCNSLSVAVWHLAIIVLDDENAPRNSGAAPVVLFGQDCA